MLTGGKWDKLHDISRRVYSGEGVAPTIHTSGGGQQEPKVVEPAINVVGNYSPSGHDASRIVATDGLAPTVKENHGTVTAVAEPFDGSSPKHNNRVVEPLVWDGYNQRIRAEQGTVGTLTTNCGADLKRNGQGVIEGMRIRKLTPKECWRLMGFDDADFEKASQHNSNSQLYKQAGNSIVVDVLAHIFTQMF